MKGDPIPTLRAFVLALGMKRKPDARALGTLLKKMGSPVDEAAIIRLLGSGGADPAQMVLRDAAGVSTAGRRIQAELRKLRDRVPGMATELQALERALVQSAPKTAAAKRALQAAREELLLLMDLESRRAREILDLAIEDLADDALRQRVRQLAGQGINGDLEAFAKELTRKLTPTQAETFLRTLHVYLCNEIYATVAAFLHDDALLEPMRRAMELALASERPERIAPTFRRLLRNLVSDDEVGATVRGMVDAADPAWRERFLTNLFAVMSDTAAGPTLRAHFDAEGLRRVLTALNSFRKNYSAVSRAKALENLVGWLYEASKEVRTLVQDAAATFADDLRRAVRGVNGLQVGKVQIHFEVTAPDLRGVEAKQATDLLGTVSLSWGKKVVHVLAAALESKGTHGIEAGAEQIAALQIRMKNGAKVGTEHAQFTVGQNLFRSVEDALDALGLSTEQQQAVLKIFRGTSSAKPRLIVYSPVPQSDVSPRIANLLKSRGIDYRPSTIPRDQMLKTAQALAPMYGLGP